MEQSVENLSNWLYGTLIFLAAMLIIRLLSLIYIITQAWQGIRIKTALTQDNSTTLLSTEKFFRPYFSVMDREEIPF